jgi:hypothetical protein
MENLIEETNQLIDKIYDDYPSGGALHIALDDGNLDDYDIQWCIDNAMDSDSYIKDKDLFLKCANNLLQLTLEQRYQILKLDMNDYI